MENGKRIAVAIIGIKETIAAHVAHDRVVTVAGMWNQAQIRPSAISCAKSARTNLSLPLPDCLLVSDRHSRETLVVADSSLVWVRVAAVSATPPVRRRILEASVAHRMA